MSDDASVLAIADEAGKISVLHDFMPDALERLSQVSLPHWHAHAVSSLNFVDSNELLSAGKEGVLVRWSLQRQEHDFVARLATASVVHVSYSDEYYSCLFENNCFKVFRTDNNKAVINVTGM